MHPVWRWNTIGGAKFEGNLSDFHRRCDRHVADVEACLWHDTNHKKVYDLDYFSGFNKDNIVKVVEKETSVSGTEEYEYESKEKIEEAFHWFEDYLIINSNKMRCDDNSVSYTFIMNNGKKYVIKTECDWIVIEGIKYYYYEKNW